MNTQKSAIQTLDDIIFDNRNHAYGAYEIRKSYNNNLNKAVLTVFGSAIVIAGLSLLHPDAKLPIIPPIIPSITDLGQAVTVIREEIRPIRHSTSTSVRDLAPRVVTIPDESLIEEPLENVPSGSDEGSVTGNEPATSGSSDGVALNVSVAALPATPTVYAHTEIMPSYNGGMEALIKFLHKHIKYPAIDRRMETQGTVYVSFILGADGQVMEAVVVKGISKGCDHEALRVIEMMPAWNPGIQGGIPVMVRMVLPIRFQLN